MDWILDHLFTLIIIAGVISQLIGAIRGRKRDADNPPETPVHEKTFEDPDLAERTRRIREEIQRKIAERQRTARSETVPPPVEEEREVVSTSTYEEPPPIVREVVVSRSEAAPLRMPANRVEAERAAEILEQQHAMQDQLRQLEEMRAAAVRRTAFEQATANHASEARQRNRGELLHDLRDPAELRRAFILREVLGPPVGLR
jgi:hypothetical protein